MNKFSKSTNELLNEICETDEIDKFLEKNSNEFADFNLSEYIEESIKERGLQKSKVAARSGLNRIYAYQIFSGKRFPSRDKLIAIGFGLELNIAEMDNLLRCSGFSTLYSRNKRDAMIIHAISNKMSVFALNELLFDNGIDILTS